MIRMTHGMFVRTMIGQPSLLLLGNKGGTPKRKKNPMQPRTACSMQPLFGEKDVDNEVRAVTQRLQHFEVSDLTMRHRLHLHKREHEAELEDCRRCRVEKCFEKVQSTLPAPKDFFLALQRFFEYGDQPLSAYTSLAAVLKGPASQAHLLDQSHLNPACVRGTVSSSRADAQGILSEQLPRFALRHALALVCRVSAMDTSNLFLSPALEHAPFASGAIATQPCVLTLYCLLQGLELELEDVCIHLAALKATPSTASALSRVEQEKRLRDHHDRILLQTERCVNSMEQTLIDLFFSSYHACSVVEHPRATLSYTAQMMRSLPDVFKEASWPCQLLGTSAASMHSSDLPSAGVDSSPTKAGELTLLDLLISPPCAAAAAAPSPLATEATLGCIGEGVTAILLHALSELKQADCCNYLQSPSSSTLTQLAAHLPMWGLSHQSPSHPVSRPVVDPVTASFPAIEARVWSGQYVFLGLRRAALEMDSLFYRLFRASEEKDAGQHPTASAARGLTVASGACDLCLLRHCWGDILERNYAAFWQRLGLRQFHDSDKGDPSACSPTAFDLKHANVFDILVEKSTTQAGSCQGVGEGCSFLTAAQQRTLSVLDTLKRLDTKGWFAFPAFDLVSIDFFSIACWIRSPSFALKSNRSSFDALRRVLERMVDACVQKYGPTHEFSECISAIRHKLVDSARAEGLL